MNDPVHDQTAISDSDRWRRFEHRRGDIVISSPPKCGTTWTQMLCALMIFDGPAFPGSLDSLSPWLDMLTRTEEEVFELYARQRHRRFIKTHTPLDGLPLQDDVMYLVVGRDPRDVLISFEHHVANVDGEKLGAVVVEATGKTIQPLSLPDDPSERLRAFLDNPASSGPNPTLASLLHHMQTGWDRRAQPNVALFHFADYQRDLVDEMVRLAAFVGLSLSRSRLAQLTPEASIARMRERAKELAPDTSKSHWRDTRRFFRSGQSGQWHERMTAADRAAYDRRVAELVDPDLAAWAHHGRSSLSSRVEPMN